MTTKSLAVLTLSSLGVGYEILNLISHEEHSEIESIELFQTSNGSVLILRGQKDHLKRFISHLRAADLVHTSLIDGSKMPKIISNFDASPELTKESATNLKSGSAAVSSGSVAVGNSGGTETLPIDFLLRHFYSLASAQLVGSLVIIESTSLGLCFEYAQQGLHLGFQIIDLKAARGGQQFHILYLTSNFPSDNLAADRESWIQRVRRHLGVKVSYVEKPNKEVKKFFEA